MARRKDNDRNERTERRAPSPSQPSRPLSPASRPVGTSVNPVHQGHAERLASEKAQREIFAQQVAAARQDSYQTHVGMLSRTPAHIAKPAVETISKIDAQKAADAAKKQARLKRGLTKQSQSHLEGKLSTPKPESGALRSVEKLRALKCAPRPKSNKPRRSGGGGGKKRFVPWC